MACSQRETYTTIFLTHWCPAIITGLIGGFVIAWVTPYFQAQVSESNAMKTRHIQLWESIGENFTHYISARSALNSVARAEMDGTLVPDEKIAEGKQEYLVQRDRARIALAQDLVKVKYYFGDAAKAEVEEFWRWHISFATVTVDKLPVDMQYEMRRNKILDEIAKKLGSSLGG
jgi:hypothetical protein